MKTRWHNAYFWKGAFDAAHNADQEYLSNPAMTYLDEAIVVNVAERMVGKHAHHAKLLRPYLASLNI